MLAGNTRSFAQVFMKANIMLKESLGMELIELFPRSADISIEAANESQIKHMHESNENDGGVSSDNEGDDGDDDDGRRKKNKKKDAGRDGQKRGTAKAFCLRTTLSDDIIHAAVKGIENEDPHRDTRRLDEEVQGALGDAVPAQLKDWKRGDDAIFDWKTGPEQRTTMGILYVILSLILVNERVLTDGKYSLPCLCVVVVTNATSAEQLMAHLKRLDLRLETSLPLNATALRPEKQTLNSLLSLLLKQGYLEKTKLANTTHGKSNRSSTQTLQGAAVTQRIRATQRTQHDSQSNNEDIAATNGSADHEWRWSSRAEREIGEQAIANFIKDLYAEHPGADRTSAKGGSQLMKEIIRGANGGSEQMGLTNAREDGE